MPFSPFSSSSVFLIEKPINRTARKDSWNDRSRITFGSHIARTNAAKNKELSHEPFLPMRSPKRKRPIIIKDLTAGILPPESPR